eukprot:Gb_25598 [translate_table: standard]
MEGTKLLMASSCAAVAPRPGQRAPASLTASGFHGSSCTFFKDGRDYLSTRKLRVRRREGKGLMVQALFGLGVPELVVIAGVTALIFGPKKLPEIGKSIGKTVKSFQQPATLPVCEKRQCPAFFPRLLDYQCQETVITVPISLVGRKCSYTMDDLMVQSGESRLHCSNVSQIGIQSG